MEHRLRHELCHRRWGWNFPAVLFVCLAAICFGCVSKHPSPEPPIDTTRPFSRSGQVAAPAEWWRKFEDPQLNALIEEAFAENLDLVAAWERLQAARAVARREASALFPDLDGFVTAETSRSDSESGGGDFFQAGLAASYEVDLWGRIRATVDAESFRADATHSDFQAAALTLSAEVAITWYRLVEIAQAEALLKSQIDANQKVLQSLIDRFQGGQVRGVDLLRQEQLLEATRERLILAESEREVFAHQLSVLLGRPPQLDAEWTITDLPLLSAPPLTGLPADLLMRRPDVRSAFHRLRTADRGLAASISERYPRLNITASLSSASPNASQLFADWTRAVAADLVGPIIDGGERRAEVERSKAVKRQRLAEFGQASLSAFREVEDALARESKQRERIESLHQQVELQSEAYERLQFEYFNGISDYLDVLTALTEVQRLRRDLLAAERQLIEFRIALYRALAGPVNYEPTSSEL